jgi:hypothetical protein
MTGGYIITVTSGKRPASYAVVAQTKRDAIGIFCDQE